MSPSTHQLPPSVWTAYIHPKTNATFELPTSWWRRDNAEFDLLAGPADDAVAALDLRTVSALYTRLETIIEEDAEHMVVKHRRLGNRSLIMSGIAIHQHDWHGARGSEGFMVRRTFFIIDDVAVILTLTASSAKWQAHTGVLDHALRTMLVLPRCAPKEDAFTHIYEKRATRAYDPRSDMIEFSR